MKDENFTTTVEVFGVPEEPLFRQAKFNGTAKVSVMPFGLVLRFIRWKVVEKKVRVSFSGYTRVVEGKKKCFPVISFMDKDFESSIYRAVKRKVLSELERLEELARVAKRNKKRDVKRRQQRAKWVELEAYFVKSREDKDEYLWSLWSKNRQKKPCSRSARGDQSDWRYQANAQIEYARLVTKFEAWKEGKERELKENFARLSKLFEEESR
ncbi:MAG: hypothetical protein AAF443_01905 [Chlamydiota bacterium]